MVNRDIGRRDQHRLGVSERVEAVFAEQWPIRADPVPPNDMVSTNRRTFTTLTPPPP